MTYEMHFDGACDNARNRLMGIGVVVYGGDGREWLAESKYCGAGTSNQAEYHALLHCLEICYRIKVDDSKASFIIRGDSQLIVHQVNGFFECKNDKLRPYYNKARKLLLGIPKQDLVIEWIPRELNTRADELSKIALKNIF